MNIVKLIRTVSILDIIRCTSALWSCRRVNVNCQAVVSIPVECGISLSPCLCCRHDPWRVCWVASSQMSASGSAPWTEPPERCQAVQQFDKLPATPISPPWTSTSFPPPKHTADNIPRAYSWEDCGPPLGFATFFFFSCEKDLLWYSPNLKFPGS